MRLSLRTDYALRTLMFLAARPGRASIPEVAKFFGISANHVAKSVNHLVKSGFLRGVRGVGGGIELRRRPEDIHLGEVVRAFEGPLHLLECVGTENVCVIQPGCKLRHVLAEAERRQVEYLSGVRLADVVNPGDYGPAVVSIAPSPPVSWCPPTEV